MIAGQRFDLDFLTVFFDLFDLTFPADFLADAARARDVVLRDGVEFDFAPGRFRSDGFPQAASMYSI